MKYPSSSRSFLDGITFSNGHELIIQSESFNGDRLDCLINIAKGKRVIHVGCADHLPLIEKKKAEDTWLHGRLQKVCQDLVGVDNNTEAMSYLREQGIKGIHNLNILDDELPTALTENRWDLMILGEIIEHLDNPVIFLEVLRERFSMNVDQLVITVPNAFRWGNFRAALRGIEFINSDHRYWFTPYTMAKVVHQAGLIATDFYFVNAWEPGNRLKRKFYNHFPQFKDTLIVIAKFSR